MKRKTGKNILKLASHLIIVVFIASACSDDKEDLGEFVLMEDSKNALPFTESVHITFIDSLGNTALYKYDSEVDYWSGERHNDLFSPLGQEYSSKTEVCGYHLGEVDKVLDVDFNIELGVNVGFQDGGVEITDVLTASLNYYNGKYYDYIQMVLHPRTASAEHIESFIQPQAQVTFLGKSFNNVCESQRSTLFINDEFGIVAFRDSENTLWVLDKIEAIN